MTKPFRVGVVLETFLDQLFDKVFAWLNVISIGHEDPFGLIQIGASETVALLRCGFKQFWFATDQAGESLLNRNFI